MPARGVRADNGTHSARVDRQRLAGLRSIFDGQVIEPGDPEYDGARQVWNAMVDRRPAVILRPAGTADVAAAVRFASEIGLEIAVKGGGHSPSGHATVDDGVMIDLHAMRGVLVDPVRLRVWAQGGARLADVDRETAAHGLAVSAGTNWDTGIAGLLLGGGYGWLSRTHGLACDNLVVAEVVTAEGEIIRADADRDPELLWGLRGGGGNFGIVTTFELQAHPVPPRVQALDMVFAPDDADAICERFFELSESWPRSVTGYLAMFPAPDGDAIPAAARGGQSVFAGIVAVDDDPDSTSILRQLTAVAEPWTTTPWAGTFRELQRLSSEAAGARRRRYWKGHSIADVSPDFVREFAARSADRPFLSEVEVFQLGGMISEMPSASSSYGSRGAAFDLLAIGYWDDPADDERRITALRAAARRFDRFSSGVYLNNLLDDGGRVREAFQAGRFDQLRALKTRLDPGNVFHRNANIPPLP